MKIKCNRAILMKKLITFPIALLAIWFHCNAQLFLGGEDKGFVVGYSNGVNFPMLDFGRENFSNLPLGKIGNGDTNRLNGYAVGIKTSFHYDFYAAWRFYHHWNVMLMYGEDVNTYDIQSLSAQYHKLNPQSQIYVTSGDNFNITQFIAGPYYCIPLSPTRSNADNGKHHSFHLNPLRSNISFEAKVLAGIVSSNYPSVFFIGPGQTTLYSFSEGRGFGYFGSVGLMYYIVDGIGIHLDVNYEGTNITYPNYSILNYNNSNTMPPNSYSANTFDSPKVMDIGLLQIIGGVSLEF